MKAWLNKHFHNSGKVCAYSNLWQQYEKVSKAAGVKWKRNALRHGFASYRVADIKDIPRTAFEAGNSPQVIQRDYLKVVTEREARRWFSIYPDPLPQVVAVGSSANANIPVEMQPFSDVAA